MYVCMQITLLKPQTVEANKELQVTYCESFPLFMFTGKYALIFCQPPLIRVTHRHTRRGRLDFTINMDVFGSVGGNWSTIKPTKEEHANPTSKGTWNLFRQKKRSWKKKSNGWHLVKMQTNF